MPSLSTRTHRVPWQRGHTTGSCTAQSCRGRQAASLPQNLPRPGFGGGRPREQLHLLAGCDGRAPRQRSASCWDSGTRAWGTEPGAHSSLCSCCSLWQGCRRPSMHRIETCRSSHTNSQSAQGGCTALRLAFSGKRRLLSGNFTMQSN